MDIYDIELRTLEGEPTTLRQYAGQLLLAVNVASRCGLTPQYEGLQRLSDRFGDRGLRVLGFPCNQFMGQEPGSAAEIREFCTTNYGVDFPMFEKLEVNGPGRHSLYSVLTEHPDPDGEAGDVHWNFEKFVISPQPAVVARFRPGTEPESSELVSVLEQYLPSSG